MSTYQNYPGRSKGHSPGRDRPRRARPDRICQGYGHESGHRPCPAKNRIGGTISQGQKRCVSCANEQGRYRRRERHRVVAKGLTPKRACMGYRHEGGVASCSELISGKGRKRCESCSARDRKYLVAMSNKKHRTPPVVVGEGGSKRCNTCADLPWRRDVMCPECMKPYADPPPIERGSVIKSSMGSEFRRHYGS